MIFKTFDSDIDKWTSKIGIFGKSFNAIFDAKKQAGSFWSYLYPKKEDIQNQLIDVDKLIPKIDISNATEMTEKIKKMSESVAKGEITWQKLFDTLPDGEKHLAKLGQQMEGQIITTEGVIKANQQARASALAHNEAIKAQTLSAKAGQVALQAFAMAGNMVLFAFISKGIQLATTAIDNWIHSAEHCKERVDELISTFNSAIDTANSHKQTIDEIKSRYEKLSKGVNSLGENVSLTTEEYSEYNDIVNQIADMFPTMVQGYTAEGNAILKLKGNVETLTEAYEAETQAAYNALIASGKDSDGNDIITDWKYSLSEDKGKGTNIVQAIKELQAFMTSDMDAEMYTILREKAAVGFYDGMTDAEKLIAGSEFIPFKLEIDLDKDGTITDEELAKAKQSAKTLLQTYNAEIESNFSNVKLLANAYLMTNEDYKNLDKQYKAAASLLLNSISATSDTAQVLMTKTKEEIGEYVNYLVQGLSEDNPEASNALINLITLDTQDLSPDEIKALVDSYISTIAGYLYMDENELKIQLGFDYVDDLETQYQRAVDFANKFDGYDPTAFFKEHSINTQEEIDAWQEIAKGARDAAEAEKEYIQSLTSNIENPISTFEDAWTDSFTSEKDAVKELGNTLLELAEQGRLTKETFNEADSTDYFKNLGISADEAVSKINKLVDESSQLSSMSSQISAMAEALGTKQENGFVEADTLAGFDVEVRGLESWDEFQKTLGSTTSSYEECQEAANALATEWVNSSDFLAQLTEQNKEYYKTQLQATGVENYEEVIAYAQELNSAKEALAQASFDIATATEEEIQALINEGTYSELAQQQIWNLILAKQTEERITLDTSADCQNLLSLAQNAGVTGTAIELLTQLLEIYNNLAAGTYGTNAQVINAVKNKAESLKNQINDILANGASGDTVELDPKIKVSPSAVKSASSAGSAAGDAYIDAFEKELEELETLRDQGK